MATVERIYTVPLKGAYNYKTSLRAKRAMKILTAFLARHMKSELGNVRIGADLNDYVWSHGIEKPPHKVKVRAKKGDDGLVLASLLEEKKPEAAAKPAEKKAEKKEKPAKPEQKAVKEVKAEKKGKPKE